MKEIRITATEEGQRLDRFLQKYLREASGSFIYKMLRKKNITLNDKKATGGEKLAGGDTVRIWFSDETLLKMRGDAPEEGTAFHNDGIHAAAASAASRNDGIRGAAASKASRNGRAAGACSAPDIVYEDEHILILNKPAGMLSQKAKPEDYSMVELIRDYLISSGSLTREQLSIFHPSVCNRLDRNTSGLIAAGKTVTGLQELSSLFSGRRLGKYYICAVRGRVEGIHTLDGALVRDRKKNQVTVSNNPSGDAALIRTKYYPSAYGKAFSTGEELTLLEVKLITGKTHQIRAHLAFDGHPLIGDMKYGAFAGDGSKRDPLARRQLLHCARMEMPVMEGPLSYLSGRVFTSPMPEDFKIAGWHPA